MKALSSAGALNSNLVPVAVYTIFSSGFTGGAVHVTTTLGVVTESPALSDEEPELELELQPELELDLPGIGE